jgi:hypothetical protein
MPSLLPADMPEGYTGVQVAQNYRRHFAPFTSFSTRQLAFFQVTLYGLDNDTLTDEELDIEANTNPYFEPDYGQEYQADGYFAKAVQAVQQNAEVFGVFRAGDGRGEGDGNSFIVMVAVDTANTGNVGLDETDNAQNGYNEMSQSIAEAVYNGTGEVDTDVYHMRLRGGDFRYSDLNGLPTDDRSQAVKSSRSK